MTIAIKTTEQLLEQDEFTWGAWMQACGWNEQSAVEAMEAAFEYGHCLCLNQPELDDDEAGVWDGGVAIQAGLVMYVGSDGPSGGTGATRVRLLLADDTFAVH